MAWEKSESPVLPTSSPNPSPNRSVQTRRTLTLAGLVLLSYYVYPTVNPNALKPQAASFAESTVASGISWWTCPDVTTTECAYLTVPRDYANPEANDTVSIFLRKFPATVPRKDYLGSILINPGGPGGSGSASAARGGSIISALVDGRYDIIGFDPRGVNMTLPPLNCFETEAQGLHSMYKQFLLGTPYDARGPHSLPAGVRAASEHMQVTRLNALFTATSLACQEQGNKRMLESVSTALVVQDMERIVDALGEDGLNFWGFSYGTILGSTFAAMRPHLVKRMVLDGVSNAESYHKDIYQWGRDGLADTHKTLSGFLDSCAEAGPDRCAFAKSTSATSADLRSRLEGLYERLRKEPMPVAKSKSGSGVLTASDAKLVVFMGLYSPNTWPHLAKSLAEAEDGNPQSLYESVYGAFDELLPEKGNKNVFNRYMEKRGLMVVTFSIMCSDSEPAGWKTLDDYVEYIHELDKISPIGENWALLAGFCKNWNFRPIQRYDGPWSVKEGLKKTRFPILYASLDADPVTPLPAAQQMAKSFGNESAVLLVQEGFGHCTVAHPSLCTAKAFRDYFVSGKVPSPGTHCKPEPGYLFPGNETKSITSLSADDQKLWKALEGLSDITREFYRPL